MADGLAGRADPAQHDVVPVRPHGFAVGGCADVDVVPTETCDHQIRFQLFDLSAQPGQALVARVPGYCEVDDLDVSIRIGGAQVSLHRERVGEHLVIVLFGSLGEDDRNAITERDRISQSHDSQRSFALGFDGPDVT